jgi:hypothetical protein
MAGVIIADQEAASPVLFATAAGEHGLVAGSVLGHRHVEITSPSV